MSKTKPKAIIVGIKGEVRCQDKSLKPSWDEYFMDMTYFVAQRSIDPSTKCGCVAVSEDKSVLSMGYNSPPRNCHDDWIPLERPEKYPYFVHAEENTMLNAARHGIALKDSTFYITGYPCSRCFRGMVNVGVKKIIYGPNRAVMLDEEEEKIINLLNKSSEGSTNIRFQPYRGIVGKVHELTRQYMEKKLESCIIDTENIDS